MVLRLLKCGPTRDYPVTGDIPVTPDLKPRYDVVRIGAGGHGLACAHCLSKYHGITAVAVLDKGWLAGGNTARNTTTIRSNYITPQGIACYKEGVSLFEGMSRELHFNVMFSQLGQLTLAHTEATLRGFHLRAETGKSMRINIEVVDQKGDRASLDPDGAADLSAQIAEAHGLALLRIMTDTFCNGWFADNWLSLIQGKTLHRCRARQVIFATGEIEQPVVFRGNDLPGIVSGGTVRRLVRHSGVRAGRRALVLAGTPKGLEVADPLENSGAKVVAVVRPRPLPGHEHRIAALRARGCAIMPGQIDEACGRAHLRQVRIGTRGFDCDLLAVSVGCLCRPTQGRNRL